MLSSTAPALCTQNGGGDMVQLPCRRVLLPLCCVLQVRDMAHLPRHHRLWS